MRIKPAGRRLQLIVSTYVSEKRRSIEKMALSWAYKPDSLSDDDRTKIRTAVLDLDPAATERADAEVAAVEAHLAEEAERRRRSYMALRAPMLPQYMSELAQALEAEEVQMTAEQADAIYQGWEKLRKTLNKQGFKKPKAPVAKPKDKRQADAFQSDEAT